MTEQQAIVEARASIKLLRAIYDKKATQRTPMKAIRSSLDLAIVALDKQIPYKPIRCNVTLGRCKCGVGFLDKSTNYCGNCGQRLDWSE